eukprot:scaffold31989_cov19-Prasinocladus_malaysianus.AAC.1
MNMLIEHAFVASVSLPTASAVVSRLLRIQNACSHSGHYVSSARIVIGQPAGTVLYLSIKHGRYNYKYKRAYCWLAYFVAACCSSFVPPCT